MDLVAFKKPRSSITLGDVALVIKICFDTLRIQNSIRSQEVPFCDYRHIYKSGISLPKNIRNTKPE